jgi:hypothetical protein
VVLKIQTHSETVAKALLELQKKNKKVLAYMNLMRSSKSEVNKEYKTCSPGTGFFTFNLF